MLKQRLNPLVATILLAVLSAVIAQGQTGTVPPPTPKVEKPVTVATQSETTTTLDPSRLSGTNATDAANAAQALGRYDQYRANSMQYIPNYLDTVSVGVAAGADIRVGVDVRNLTIREAIKHIFGKADLKYEVDPDVSDKIRVTLRADNITLTTAINALIESTGIGCTANTNTTTTDANGKHTAETRVYYHFIKRASGPLVRWRFPDINGNANSNNYGYWNVSPTASQWIDRTVNPAKAKGATNQQGAVTPDKQTTPPAPPVQKSTTVPGYVLPQGALPYVFDNQALPRFYQYNFSTAEERSTFTCPHCKEQVTIIKKHTAPKCPTCGRVFMDDWKFCPFDGTKRPAETTGWNFCPHCGKAI